MFAGFRREIGGDLHDLPVPDPDVLSLEAEVRRVEYLASLEEQGVVRFAGHIHSNLPKRYSSTAERAEHAEESSYSPEFTAMAAGRVRIFLFLAFSASPCIGGSLCGLCDLGGETIRTMECATTTAAA